MKDLFGDEIKEPPKHTGKRRPTQAHGYAAPPGTGPDGETCKSCDHHYCREYHSKRYHKCDLVKETRGTGSDIRVGWPACKRWEKIKNETVS